MMLRRHFQFPDGDRYPIHLSETALGGLRLSDRGHKNINLLPLYALYHLGGEMGC